MREIKFRAFDGNQWSYFTIGQTMTAWMQAVYDDHCLHGRQFFQFTGLKDKNGKEIYEGDIMSTGHGWSNYTVVFEDGSFCFGNDQPNGADRLSQDRVGRLEVVGNIYENKNLLTPTP